MATKVESLPSPPLLGSEREQRDGMSTCQVDVRLEAGQAAPGPANTMQQLTTAGHGGDTMAQGGIAMGAGELNVKMLMSSRVSYFTN